MKASTNYIVGFILGLALAMIFLVPAFMCYQTATHLLAVREARLQELRQHSNVIDYMIRGEVAQR